MYAWVLTRTGGNLRRQQRQNDPVLVGSPDGAVIAQEARSCALFATETDRAVEQTRSKPLETDRNLRQTAALVLYYSVNHAAANQRFSDCCSFRPIRTVVKQIV